MPGIRLCYWIRSATGLEALPARLTGSSANSWRNTGSGAGRSGARFTLTALGIDPHAEYDLPGFPTFHRVEDRAESIREVLA